MMRFQSRCDSFTYILFLSFQILTSSDLETTNVFQESFVAIPRLNNSTIESMMVPQKNYQSGFNLVSTNSSDNVSEVSSEQPFSRSYCSSKYGKRSLLPSNSQRLPPILYTFPGSGNTWSRLLIEYSTGIFTGSIYKGTTVFHDSHELPEEATCSRTVSVIKVTFFVLFKCISEIL